MKTYFTRFIIKTSVTVFVFMLTLSVAFSQEAMDYDFSVTQSASLFDMSSGTKELIGSNKLKINSNVTPIGFEVWFMGKRYTNFSVSCNGVLRFGTTAIHPEGNAYNVPNNARIAGFSCLDRMPHNGSWKTSSNGKIHYKFFGQSPQRKLVIEWKNLHANYLSDQENITFQMVIHETAPQSNQPQGGQIELIYGKMSLFKPFNNIRLGIGGENGGKEYMGIDLSSSPPFVRLGEVNNALDSGEVPFLNSLVERKRTKFTLRSPIPDVQAQNLRTNCSQQEDGIQLDWDLDRSGGNIIASVLYKSTDGINYTFLHQTKSVEEITYFDADVDLTKTYWYRVYTVTEGQLSELQTKGELKVTPNKLQEFELGQFTICNQDVVVLDAGSSYTDFVWYDESGNVIGTEQKLKIETEGRYHVIVSQPNGCKKKGNAHVVQSSSPVFEFTSVYAFCEGESIQIEAPEGFAQYEWFSWDNKKQADGQVWRVTKKGKFHLKVTHETGCFTIKPFTCITKATPNIKVLGEPFLCEKMPEITLTASETSSSNPDLNYQWFKNNSLISESPEVNIKEVGTYSVSVSNAIGCKKSKTIQVKDCCKPVLKIPNAFTPFSTPDNNEYRVAHRNLLTFNMKIYNRWGILIFETDDPNEPWNGTFKNKKLQPSVYQLIINYTGCKDGVTFQKKETEAIYLLD